MGELDYLIGSDIVNLLCRVIVIITVLINWRSMGNIDSKKGTGFFFAWIVLTIYSVFYSPIDGDNFTSMDKFLSFETGVDENVLHFEPIYFLIMGLSPSGYVGYRFILWGTGMALIVLLTKKLKYNPHISTIFLIGFALLLLNYQRAIIGYALLYWSLYFIINAFDGHGFRDKINILISLGLLLLALPFHKTMIIYEIILVVSLLFPRNKYLFLCVLFVGVIIPSIFPRISDLILSYTPDETREKALRYTLSAGESGTVAKNLFGYISFFVQRGSFFFILGYCLWNIKSNDLNFTHLEQVLLINTFMLYMVSLFYGNQFNAVSGKLFYASLLPFSLFMSSFYTRTDKLRVKNLFTTLLVISILGSATISLMAH